MQIICRPRQNSRFWTNSPLLSRSSLSCQQYPFLTSFSWTLGYLTRCTVNQIVGISMKVYESRVMDIYSWALWACNHGFYFLCRVSALFQVMIINVNVDFAEDYGLSKSLANMAGSLLRSLWHKARLHFRSPRKTSRAIGSSPTGRHGRSRSDGDRSLIPVTCARAQPGGFPTAFRACCVT